jgi:hypothetical protein
MCSIKQSFEESRKIVDHTTFHEMQKIYSHSLAGLIFHDYPKKKLTKCVKGLYNIKTKNIIYGTTK